MSQGEKIGRAKAEELFLTFIREYKLGGIPALLAGSYRRGKATMGDVDIIFFPRSGTDEFKIRTAFLQAFGTLKSKKGVKKTGTYKGVSFDCEIASAENRGAMLLFKTGSATFNIKMRARAKARGMLLNQYGLWLDGEQVAGVTEESIFTGLQLGFKEPEER